MSEQTIPQREMTNWQTSAYARLRGLYPLDASPTELRAVISKEASFLYKAAPITRSLGDFAQLYGISIVRQMEVQGYEVSRELPLVLSTACLAGVLAAIDINAYALSEEDRQRLFTSYFDIPISEDSMVETVEELYYAQAASVLDMVEQIESLKIDPVPFELRQVGEAMFRDSHPMLALEQERAFGVGASVLYDVMIEATYYGYDKVLFSE